MLIRVPELSQEDVQHFAAMERVDRARASLSCHRDLVRRSVRIAEAFLQATKAKCYVSTSWGKDSVVTSHIVFTAAARMGILPPPLVHHRPSENANHHTDAVADRWLERFPRSKYHRITVTETDANWRVVRDETAAKAAGSRNRVMGIRGAESAARKRAMTHLGETRGRVCWPIAKWPTADVFAYLASHDLPVHPAYAMTMDGSLDRDRLRVDELADDPGTGFGRAEWEERYYPGVGR